jgi:hypothetical protein
MRKPKIVKLNDNEVLFGNNNIEIKKEQNEEKDELDKVLQKHLEITGDKKIRFAKVNWGTGKGPYILAFENSSDYNYCECNAHELKPLKIQDIKQNFVHIWSCGIKTPEEINKLPTINIEEYKISLKEDKNKNI